MNQRRSGRRRARVLASLGALSLAVALGACRGENLFSLTASVGEPGPQVNITQPGEAFTIAPGDSILVLADINATDGVVTIDYRGDYVESGEPAYVAETEEGGGSTFVRTNNRLRAVDAPVEGEVFIVVEATDQAGNMGKDSVRIAIVN